MFYDLNVPALRSSTQRDRTALVGQLFDCELLLGYGESHHSRLLFTHLLMQTPSLVYLMLMATRVYRDMF